MKGKPLTLEKYHRFFLDPWGTHITIDQLNQSSLALAAHPQAGGTGRGAAASATVPASAFVGADPHATSLGHAHDAAASFAAVLGLAAAHTARASAGMERIYASSVLPGAVLGCAQCAAATAAACALALAAHPGAALGQHVVANSAPAHATAAITTSRSATPATTALAGAAGASCAASDTTASHATAPSTAAFPRAASTSCSPSDTTTSHAGASPAAAFAGAAAASCAASDTATSRGVLGQAGAPSSLSVAKLERSDTWTVN